MNATLTAGKMARLNVIVRVIREWQRGALAWTAVQFQADLTDAQMAILDGRVRRTISEGDLARVVADMLGL